MSHRGHSSNTTEGLKTQYAGSKFRTWNSKKTHLCHYIPPWRRQNNADRKTPFMRCGYPGSGSDQKTQREKFRGIGLDGDRKTARHLGHFKRHEFWFQRISDQHSWHPGPSRFQRRHIPNSHRGRQCHHADWRSKRSGGTDKKTLPCVPDAGHSYFYVHQ